MRCQQGAWLRLRAGVNVVVVARGAEALQQAKAQLESQAPQGTQVVAVAADITTSAGRAQVFAMRCDFDILVTNAGGPPAGRLPRLGIAGIARSQLAASNVTINNLLPGPFDTERLRATVGGLAKKSGRPLVEVMDERRAAVPAKRFGTPEEFGAACAFLCSVHAAYIVGQNILLDGGSYPGTF